MDTTRTTQTITLARKSSPLVIFALFLVHFSGDLYMSFVAPLLPVLTENFNLTMTQVGLVAGVNRLMAFVVQPSVGYLADRYRTRLFILGGPIMSAVFIPLLGVAPGYWAVLLFVCLGSIGCSMFHPPAAGMIPDYAGRSLSFSMSLFQLGGIMSFGVGPLFVTWYVSRYGFANLPQTMIFGLAVAGLLFFIVPLPEGEGMRNLGFWGSIKDAVGAVWKSIALLWCLIVLRTFVSQSFMTFGVILFKAEGYDLQAIGLIVACYVTAGAVSGLLAGHLADRIGYKPIFFFSYSLATPSLYLLLIAPGSWKYTGAFIAGFLTLATMALAVSMAQELAPRGKSLVSSLMMGLAFGFGGLMTPITGKLADMFSIKTVLSVVLWIPLLALFLVTRLPGRIERGEK